jgi:protein tyrosine phosphatase (PTP) superfamily phosphohydrolase (DUF442 family)
LSFSECRLKEIIFMPINFAVAKCTLPVAGDICFKSTGLKTFLRHLATGLHLARHKSLSGDRAGRHRLGVVGARPRGIYPALDAVRSDQDGPAGLNGVAYSNIPLPHISMTQAQFNRQGLNIARTLNGWEQPGLIHCCSGDRASAAFACYLISFCRLTTRKR